MPTLRSRIAALRDWARGKQTLAFAAWALGVVVLAVFYWSPRLTPPTSIADVELGLDKLFHAGAHAALLAWPLAILAGGRLRVVAVAVAIVVAPLFELGQFWIPGRSFGFDDLAANLIGLALGLAVARLLDRA